MNRGLCAECGTTIKQPPITLEADEPTWTPTLFDSAECLQSWLSRTGRTYAKSS